MELVIERKIGKVFEYKGFKLITKERPVRCCEGCFFFNNDCFEAGAKWADSTYVKGDIEKESESYAQSVIGDIPEDIRHLLATVYIAGAKRIEL